MASNVFGAKTFKGTPPEKGSFPLDHEGECKKPFLKYMVCLSENKNAAASCKVLAKEYLSCRMERNLMAKEEWDKLGFKDSDLNDTKKIRTVQSNNSF